MSKSMGNVISPLDLIKEFGADILRLWVASIDYRNDVGISKEIMKITADAYRTIRNTFRFQVGNLFDFDPQADLLPVESLNPLDRWALHQIAVLVKDVTEAYGNYEFHRVFHLLNRFYTVTLSSRYHDFLKDRLYTFRHDSEDRRSAQTVIYHHLNALTRLWSPILVFTTDEVWPHIKASGPDAGLKSVHLAHWPQVPANWVHSELNNEVETLLNLRDKVNEKLEELRSQKAIGKSIDAAVTLLVNGNTPEKALLEKYREELPELFIVSQVIIGSSAEEDATIQIQAAPAEGVRCPRCWRTVAILTSTRSGEVCPRCAEAIASLATNSN